MGVVTQPLHFNLHKETNMARIYKCTDKIPLKIHDLKVKISPLTFDQKNTCQGMIMSGNQMSAAFHALQCSLKELDGIENGDGSKYELEFEDGIVAKACMDDLLNLSESQDMQLVAISLINGIPKEFNNPVTGGKLEGVEFIKEKKSRK